MFPSSLGARSTSPAHAQRGPAHCRQYRQVPGVLRRWDLNLRDAPLRAVDQARSGGTHPLTPAAQSLRETTNFHPKRVPCLSMAEEGVVSIT
jgi:hypothetical protein